MSILVWKALLVVLIGSLTGALLLLCWFIFISSWHRTFGVVAIFALFVVYSNLLAKAFVYVQLHISKRRENL